MPNNNWISLGALLAGLAVATGAFGAHALQPLLPEKALKTWETAVHYHMFHALGLLVCGIVLQSRPQKTIVLAGRFLLLGLLLFSGSLYAMVLLQAGGAASYRWLGAITPLGGVSFMIGWALLVWSFRRPR